jgi:renalase
MVDVAVIGAGLTGLTCAQHLQQMGYQVVVLEKSRGLGGRLATRRLHHTWADHGLAYFTQEGTQTAALVQLWRDRGILHPWINQEFVWTDGTLYPGEVSVQRYVSPVGITAIAKVLAAGLEIWRGQRVEAIAPTDNHTWAFTLEPVATERMRELTARSVVVTAPAPQAAALLDPLQSQGIPAEFFSAVQSVTYQANLTAIALYPSARQVDLAQVPWRSVQLNHPQLAWVIVDSSKQDSSKQDSSKQPHPPQPIVVLHGSTSLSDQFLDTPDLEPAGKLLLEGAATCLLPWLAEPEVLQLHRWRYALPQNPRPEACLSTINPLPLVCGGDWCAAAPLSQLPPSQPPQTTLPLSAAAGTSPIEHALNSGIASAQAIHRLLKP